MPPTKTEKNDLLDTVKMFQAIADDPKADPEERRKSRAIVRSYYEDDDDENKAKARARAAARPPLRLVSQPTPAPTPAAASSGHGLSYEQQRALDRLDGRIGDGSATSAHAEGAVLVLDNMSPEHAAARAKELAAQGVRPRQHDMESLLGRLKTTERR